MPSGPVACPRARCALLSLRAAFPPAVVSRGVSGHPPPRPLPLPPPPLLPLPLPPPPCPSHPHHVDVLGVRIAPAAPLRPPERLTPATGMWHGLFPSTSSPAASGLGLGLGLNLFPETAHTPRPDGKLIADTSINQPQEGPPSTITVPPSGSPSPDTDDLLGAEASTDGTPEAFGIQSPFKPILILISHYPTIISTPKPTSPESRHFEHHGALNSVSNDLSTSFTTSNTSAVGTSPTTQLCTHSDGHETRSSHSRKQRDIRGMKGAKSEEIPPELATLDAPGERDYGTRRKGRILHVVPRYWDLLAPEFVREWAQLAARSAIEKTAELLNHKLKPEDVGTIVLIDRAYTNWSTFIEAVMAIDIIRLKERVELSKVIEMMVALIEELKADFQWQERNRHGTSKQQPAADWHSGWPDGSTVLRS
ncbi:hypothetical protein BGW80DRAFT_1561090 [Lactifluus volemus]|nr:hypothetical protein BGW80DRAFT_1561090 [Lactifluus volemus]